MKKSEIIKHVFATVFIIAIIIACLLIFKLLGISDLTQDELREIITSFGFSAPLIYILITILQVTLIPIPGAITILAGNYLFGAALSYLYSYLGMMIGSVASFALGRFIGRPFVNWMAGGADKVDEWIAKLRGREGVLLFFMFLLPLFPDDLLCAISGILPIGWGTFIVMQLFTRATSIGGTLLFMSGEVIPYEGWGLALIVFLLLLAGGAFILSIKYTDKIHSFLSKIADKLVSKKSDKKNRKSEHRDTSDDNDKNTDGKSN